LEIFGADELVKRVSKKAQVGIQIDTLATLRLLFTQGFAVNSLK
jgi:hypothetical protein